jgi:hypothetical protein
MINFSNTDVSFENFNIVNLLKIEICKLEIKKDFSVINTPGLPRRSATRFTPRKDGRTDNIHGL